MIVTKYDFLDAKAYRTLVDEGASREEAKAHAPKIADERFNKTYLPLIQQQKHTPKEIVCLRSMQHTHTNIF